jgi:hypothetical protein
LGPKPAGTAYTYNEQEVAAMVYLLPYMEAQDVYQLADIMVPDNSGTTTVPFLEVGKVTAPWWNFSGPNPPGGPCEMAHTKLGGLICPSVDPYWGQHKIRPQFRYNSAVSWPESWSLVGG